MVGLRVLRLSTLECAGLRMMTRSTYHKSSQLPNKPKRKKKPKGTGIDRKKAKG